MKINLHFIPVPCPLCKANDYKILFRDKNRRELINIETNVVKCRICGMVYLNPLPDMNEFISYYEKIYLEARSKNKRRLPSNRFLLRLFGKLKQFSQRLFPIRDYRTELYKKQSANFLDIGCNDGKKLQSFVEKGYKVWGIDINASAINNARENFPDAHFYVGTIETAKIPKKYFDYIQLDNVLEHIYEPLKFLKKLKLYLKDDGEVILYIPSISTWQFWLFGRFYSQSWIPFHINLFSKKTICKMAKKAGYNIEHLYSLGDPWWVILSIRQLLNWRRKRPVTFKKNHWTALAFAFWQPICWVLTHLGNADSLVVVLGKNRRRNNI